MRQTGGADVYQHAAHSKCFLHTHLVRQVLLSTSLTHRVVAVLVQGHTAGWEAFSPLALLLPGQSCRTAVPSRGHAAGQRQPDPWRSPDSRSRLFPLPLWKVPHRGGDRRPAEPWAHQRQRRGSPLGHPPGFVGHSRLGWQLLPCVSFRRQAHGGRSNWGARGCSVNLAGFREPVPGGGKSQAVPGGTEAQQAHCHPWGPLETRLQNQSAERPSRSSSAPEKL